MFEDLGKGAPIPEGYKLVPCHIVYDVKWDRRHKSCMVARGHRMDTPIKQLMVHQADASFGGCGGNGGSNDRPLCVHMDNETWSKMKPQHRRAWAQLPDEAKRLILEQGKIKENDGSNFRRVNHISMNKEMHLLLMPTPRSTWHILDLPCRMLLPQRSSPSSSPTKPPSHVTWLHPVVCFTLPLTPQGTHPTVLTMHSLNLGLHLTMNSYSAHHTRLTRSTWQNALCTCATSVMRRPCLIATFSTLRFFRVLMRLMTMKARANQPTC